VKVMKRGSELTVVRLPRCAFGSPFGLSFGLPVAEPDPLPAPASGSSRSSIASSSASAVLALAAASASAVGESAGAAARSLRRAAALPAFLVGCSARIDDRTCSSHCSAASV
jgi:hypothetical protein